MSALPDFTLDDLVQTCAQRDHAQAQHAAALDMLARVLRLVSDNEHRPHEQQLVLRAAKALLAEHGRRVSGE